MSPPWGVGVFEANITVVERNPSIETTGGASLVRDMNRHCQDNQKSEATQQCKRLDRMSPQIELHTVSEMTASAGRRWISVSRDTKDFLGPLEITKQPSGYRA